MNLMCVFSMLHRYSILHSDHSPVKLAKVMYDNEICGGLEATRDIPAASYILSTVEVASTHIPDAYVIWLLFGLFFFCHISSSSEVEM